MILAVGDAVWNAIIAGVVTIVLSVIANRNANRSAAKLDAIAETGDKTHILVNSNMGVQLKIAAVALRRLASSGNPEDVAAAELAEKLLREHESKQASVDRRETKS